MAEGLAAPAPQCDVAMNSMSIPSQIHASSAGPQRPFRWSRLFIYAALIAWAFVCLMPVYWMAITSLKDEAAITDGPVYLPFIDFWPTLHAWIYIFTDPADSLIWRFYNSTLVGVSATALTILFGGMASYGLTRFRYAISWQRLALLALACGCATAAIARIAPAWQPLLAIAAAVLVVASARIRARGPTLQNDGLVFAILATRILPPAVVALPIYLMAASSGLLDSRTSLIFTYTAANLPVAVWLLQPVFGASASDQEEAALIDGASWFRIFFSIAVPMAAAGIAATAALVFILCWNEYLFAAFLTGSRAGTLPPFMIGQMSMREAQVAGEAEEWANLSAAAMVMVFPMVICGAMAFRVLGRMASRRS